LATVSERGVVMAWCGSRPLEPNNLQARHASGLRGDGFFTAPPFFLAS